MTDTNTIIDNAILLDPMHGVAYEPRTVQIKNGIVQDQDVEPETPPEHIDAGGRIVVPGGILPSVRLPPARANLLKNLPARLERSLLMTGFTTAIFEGMTPFSALDQHAIIQRVRAINKVPILDIANNQLMLGFLKNGVTNYASELARMLLERYRAFGISCFQPGSTARWKNVPVGPKVAFQPIPFGGMTPVKIISETIKTRAAMNLQPVVLTDLGLDAAPTSFEDLDAVVQAIESDAQAGDSGTGSDVGIVQASLLSASALDSGDTINDKAKALCDLLEGHERVAFFLDIPGDIRQDTAIVELGPSSIHHVEDVTWRSSIEGEVEVLGTSVKARESRVLLERASLSSLALVLDASERIRERLCFSLLPQILHDPGQIAAILATMVCADARKRLFSEPSEESIGNVFDSLEGKIITLEELIRITRCVPARLLGIDAVVGGLGSGQFGDAIILNAKQEDLDGILADRDRTLDLLENPHAVIKEGNLLVSEGRMNARSKAPTFQCKIEKNESIANSISDNFTKQFVKYYSTHVETKDIPERFTDPVHVVS
jgi:formylmethanofuran dehydrogenase subunit A